MYCSFKLPTFIQCAIVVFDGLLPEPHNKSVCTLLFGMAHWHSLAKLRMHHDLTLDVMDTVAISLGNSLRHFSQVTCAAFETRELGREYSARMRQKARVAANKKSSPPSSLPGDLAAASAAAAESSMPNLSSSKTTQSVNHPDSASTSSMAGTSTATASNSESNGPAKCTDLASKSARKRANFNIDTYKCHSFPDYVNTIRRFGTTDSYSTEPVSRDSLLRDICLITLFTRENLSIEIPSRGILARAARTS